MPTTLVCRLISAFNPLGGQVRSASAALTRGMEPLRRAWRSARRLQTPGPVPVGLADRVVVEKPLQAARAPAAAEVHAAPLIHPLRCVVELVVRYSV